MSKQHDYRAYAAELIDLASRANSTSHKGRLLAMAEAWLQLADRAPRVLGQQTAKLRDFPPPEDQAQMGLARRGLTRRAACPAGYWRQRIRGATEC
jgi:hypothetical protein